MATKKIITVFGATGAQGGSIVQTFLNDPKLKSEWKVRAITRDTTKESAKKLECQGAETVAADLNDKSSLVNAMTGAHTAFAVTNYWEKMDKQLEIKQGKDIVDAAKEAGLQHLIWSSLVDVDKLTNHELPHVYHFDSKAQVEVYAREVGIPATFFLPGMYMANFPDSMLRQTPPDNNWTLAIPLHETATVPLLDTADTGKFIKAIVLNRDKLLGKQVHGATAYYSVRELLDDFKATFPEAGKKATYFQMPNDMYLGALTGVGMPDFAAEELLENMLLIDKYGYYGGASLDESHAILEDKLTTWAEFLKTSPKLKDLN